MVAWNPWRALRGMDVDLWFAPLPSGRGLWRRERGRDVIYLDERLGRRERREVLAHEIVHVERGIGWPAPAALMAREEAIVWAIALDRLVPPERLQRFLRCRGSVGPVGIAEVAEEFDLSADGAGRLLARWQRRTGGLLLPPTEAA